MYVINVLKSKKQSVGHTLRLQRYIKIMIYKPVFIKNIDYRDKLSSIN